MVSNPSIGYGCYTIRYKNGDTKEDYRIGLSGNTAGISVYIMGLEDKTLLPRTIGKRIDKASVTGYCVKFKRLADIDLELFDAAILDAVAQTSG